MFHQQDGEVEVCPDPLDQIPQFINLTMGQAAGGFVQQQQLRRTDERAGEFHPLLGAKGQRRHHDVRDRCQFQQMQQIRGLFGGLLLLRPCARQAQSVADKAGTRQMMRADQNILPHGHGTEQRHILERPADADIHHLMALRTGDDTIFEADFTRRIPVKSTDAVE